MAKAAKAPAKKTSPVVWVAIVGAAAAAYLVLTPSDTPTSGVTAAKKPKKTAAKNEGAITEADYEAYKTKFPPVALAAVDAFNPLIKKDLKIAVLPVAPLDGRTQEVPVALTGGEANWYYTGCPSLNGVREALLENTVTGESTYVHPGDRWKAARVQGVDIATVTLVGSTGAAVDVPIVQYGEVPGAAKTAVASNAPLAIPPGAISGAIGARAAAGPQVVTLANGSTIQLPLPDANGQAAVPGNNDQGGRRRGRNRNRNQGDPNNGF